MLPNTNIPSARVQMQREGLDPAKEIPVGIHHPQAVNDPNAGAREQIEDLKRSIASRFSSVATPSNMLQAGLFNALGNNPVTQTISAAGGAVSDIWNSLLSTPEEKEGKSGKGGKSKDPLTALNKHTELLDEILFSLDSMGDAIKYMAYEGGRKPRGGGGGRGGGSGGGGDQGGGGGGHDGKPHPRSGKFVNKGGEDIDLPKTDSYPPPDYRSAEDKERDSDQRILDALKADQVGLREEIEKASDEEKTELQAQLKDSQAAIEELENKLDTKKFNPEARINMTREQFEEAATREQAQKALGEKPASPEAKPYVPPMETPSTKLNPEARINMTRDEFERQSTKEVADKNKPFNPDERINVHRDQFFTQMFDRMGMSKASNTMENFTKTMQKASGELSKNLGEAGSAVKKKSKPLVDAIKGSETAKYMSLAKSKTSDIASKISQGATSTVASMATGLPMTAAPKDDGHDEISDAIAASGVTPNPSALDVAMDGAEAAGAVGWLGKGWKAAKTAGAAGLGVLKSGGSKALEMAKNSGGFLKTAGLAHLATSGIEAAYDSFNTGTEDYAKRMGTTAGESTAGDLATRAAGTLQDFGNRLTFGGADRLGNWLSGNGFKRSDYYENKDKVNPQALEAVPMVSRAEAISETKSQIDEAKNKPDNGPDTVIGSVNNTTHKNTTILPSRTSVSNTDDSFKRYVGRSYDY